LTILYNLFVRAYYIIIRIAALWNPKAQRWINGRKNVFDELKRSVSTGNVVWIHSASAGEFEQAKPIIESLKKNYPSLKIVASFFSPSGYDGARSYRHTDHNFYLPLDTISNARRLLECIAPRLVIFIKYEFWYHHLKVIQQQKIPLLLVSAVFRESQPFFKWYGGFYLRMLHFFQHIFVQDGRSLELLHSVGIVDCSISGDNRFDRVHEIASSANDIRRITEFIGEKPVIVAGSTWPDDEFYIRKVIEKHHDLKFIIAPHEVTKEHLRQIKTMFPSAIFYSELDELNLSTVNVLVIDSMGLLSTLYKYASIAYVGGGYTKDGIHNILEAAVYGKPVVFGPNYKKYREAIQLINCEGAFSFSTEEELLQLVTTLLQNKEVYNRSSQASAKYVADHIGATGKLMAYIQEKRLLIN